MAVIDPRLELARQRRAAALTSRVTTLSDVMGRSTPRATVAPLTPGEVQSGALLDLRSQAASRFADAQRRREAMGIAEGGRAEPGGLKGVLADVLDNPITKAALKPLEILDIPRRYGISVLKETVDAINGGDASFSDFMEQVKDPTFGFGDVVQTGNKWLDRVIGFAGDVALDPLTYATFGTGVLAKQGVMAAGSAGRLALATRVLDITGDAEKAAVAAQRGLSGARKVLTAEQLSKAGLNKSGVYLFGKHLPAVRVPMTGGISEAAESGLARLRLAATQTKVGTTVQAGLTPKWLKSERLALLRGEVQSSEFAEKLYAVNSRNAYRAAAGAAARRVGGLFNDALRESGIQETPQMRQRLHLLLEGVEQPASAAETRALDVWRKAFETLWDELDSSLTKLDPSRKFGRVQRYMPHALSEDGRKFLAGGSPEAKRLVSVFGQDDLGATTFFQPRRLVADGETKFFGRLLEEGDLTVGRLNEIAREGGFVGDFFETDIVNVAQRYATDWADQMGRVGAIGSQVDSGTIAVVEKKLEFDPQLAVEAQRTLGKAIGGQVDAGRNAANASRRAAAAVQEHLLGVRRAAEAAARSGDPRPLGLDAYAAAAGLREARDAAATAAAEAVAKRQALNAVLDPELDRTLFELVDQEMAEILEKSQQQVDLLDRYEEMANGTVGELVMSQRALDELNAEIEKLAKEIPEAAERQKQILEFNEWLATAYEDLIDGKRKVSPSPVARVNANTLKAIFSTDQARVEQVLGKYSQISGEFSEWLAAAADNDPTLMRLLGDRQSKNRLGKMTVAQADRLLQSGLNASVSPLAAHLGATVRIAQVLKFFGGVDNIPQSMRRVFNSAMEAAETFGQLADWDRLLATAPRNTGQYERLAARYGAISAEIYDDMELLSDLALERLELEERILGIWSKTDELSVLEQEELESLEALLSFADQKYNTLLEKRYTLLGDAGGEAEAATLGVIAKAELDAIGYTVERMLATHGDQWDSTVQQMLQRREQLYPRPSREIPSYPAEEAFIRADENNIRARRRFQDAELVESANTSRRVQSGRRTPFTQEQRLRQIQIKRGEAAAEELAANPNSPKKALLERRVEQGRRAKKLEWRAGDPNAPWMVQGRTAFETRQDAMLKMEEFLIFSEVSRRFTSLTEEFAKLGLPTTDKMLNDILRVVRTERAATFAGKQRALRAASSEIAAISQNLERVQRSSTVVAYSILEVYERLGDDAVRALGPADQWMPRAQGQLTEIARLEKLAASKPARSAARKQALDELTDYFNGTVRPYFRSLDQASKGKVSRAVMKRRLKASAEAAGAKNNAEAARKLNDFRMRLESEALFYTRMEGLYKQLDDPDYDARLAMNVGLRRQQTPMAVLAAREAAVRKLEEIVEAAPATAKASQGKIAAAAAARDAAVREANVVKLRRGQVEKIQQQLEKLTSNPLYGKAVRDEEATNWLTSMVNVDGWKLTVDDWVDLGINLPAQDDVAAMSALQKFIDERRANGQDLFVQTKTLHTFSYGKFSYQDFVYGYRRVTRASDVPPGAVLVEKTEKPRVLRLTESQLIRDSKYKPDGFGDLDVVADQRRELSSAERLLENDKAQFERGLQMKARIDAGERVTRRSNTSSAEDVLRGDAQLIDVSTDEIDQRLVQLHQRMAGTKEQIAELRAKLKKSEQFQAVRRQQINEPLEQYLERVHPGTYRRVVPPAEMVDGKLVQPTPYWEKTVNPSADSRMNATGYAPVAYEGPALRPMVEQPFTEAEWESLFIGDSPTSRAGVKKRLGEINSELNAAVKEQLRLDQKRQKALAALERERQFGGYATPYDEAVEYADLQIAMVGDRIAALSGEQRRFQLLAEASFDDGVRASARQKFDALYDGFVKSFPGGLDNQQYRELLKMSGDGRAATAGDVVVSARKQYLTQQWEGSEGFKLLEQERELNRSGYMKWAESITVDVARTQQQLKDARKRLADAWQPVRDSLAELAEELGVTSAADVKRLAELSQSRLTELKAQVAEIRSTVGKTAGPPTAEIPQETLDRMAAETARMESELAALREQVLPAEQRLGAAVEADNAAKALAAGGREEVAKAQVEIDKQLDELVAVEVQMRGDLRAARKKAAGEALAAARTGRDKRRALAQAQSRYDQVLAVDVRRAADVTEAAERQARLAAIADEIEAVIGSPKLVERVAGQKPLSAADRATFERQVRDGDRAAKKLAKDESLPKKEAARLEKMVADGTAASASLRAADVSDMEAVALNRIYEQIMRSGMFDEFDGPNPLATVLGEALAGEAELLLSKQAVGAAEQALYDAKYLSGKLVDDVRDGWKKLEDWGLPGLQASKELVEIFDNISRVQAPGLAKELGDFMAKYTMFFKSYATLSPGFHVRNALSNTFMVFAAGSDIGNMRRGMRLYNGWVESRRAGVEAERAWIASLPAAERDQFTAALRITDAAGGGRFTDALAQAGQPGVGRVLNNAALRASRRFGDVVEGSGRFMLAYDSVVKGMDFNTASARVKRFLFDYVDTSAVDDVMKNIIPFWMWMSRNLPLQIVNQWQNPKAYAIYASLMRNIREDDENDVVPSWLKEQGAAKVADNWYLAPDFGFTRLGEQLTEMADPARLAGYVNPALRLPVEVLGKRRLYNDVPFSETPQEVTGGLAQPLLEALLRLTGQTQTTADGRIVTDPKINYALQNLLPPLSQAERLVPATEDYKAKQAGSWLSYFGVPVRQVTPQMRESELKRRQREIEEMARAAEALGFAP